MKSAKFLIIICLCFTIAGSLVLATFSWFYVSDKINSDNSSIQSSETATIKVVSFDQATEQEKAKYQGQTGCTPVGTEDAPYKLTRKFDIDLVPIGADSILSINFNKLTITTRDGRVITPTKEEQFTMFTWRLTITEGANSQDYYPDSIGKAHLRSGWTPASDGALFNVKKGRYTFTLSLIFQAEGEYKKWENLAPATAITPFAFSDKSYMRSKFDIALNLNLEVDVTPKA